MASIKRTLVIVESGAKAKTISKYLNAIPEVKTQYGHCDVVACFGHIMDLDRKGLGIDVKDFKPALNIIPEKQKLVKELKSKVAKSTWVLLASDADREGAAIAKHLRVALGLRSNFNRITFNEITPSALKSAIANAGDIDEHLVQAQQARRVLDRLVGYEISPLLWQHFKNGGLLKLSAGRVQSATLNLLVSKHQEALAFESESYYTMQSSYRGCASMCAQLYTDKGKGTIVHLETDDKEVGSVIKQISTRHVIEDVYTKSKSESPPKPFATPTLQQEAHTKLGLPVSRTMKLAQDLYEAGHITYMRTDSTHLSVDASNSISAYIKGAFGDTYLFNHDGDGSASATKKSSAKSSTKSSKHSQEAHECIRPTDVNQTHVIVDKNMTAQHAQLYELIWQRTVASMMAKMLYNETTVIISEPSIAARDWAFVIKSKAVVFDGYTRIYAKATAAAPSPKANTLVSDFKKGTVLECHEVLAHQVWSSPPSRYNDATLIKAMEHHGIGRPSTYASVLAKLLEKQYIEKKTIAGIEKKCVDMVFNPKSSAIKSLARTVTVGEDKNKLVPTDIGMNVNAFIVSYFSQYSDSKFTASMELELDRLAKGQVEYKSLMHTFWKGLDDSLKAYNHQHKKKDQQAMDIDKGKVIVVDKVPYTLRRTKYGPAVQFINTKDDTKKFISLKAYMKITSINELEEIGKNDIRLLVALPSTMKHDKSLKLHYGQYGFYVKRGDQSYSMFLGKHYTREDVPGNLLDLPKDALERITSWTPKSKAT